jgi:hypothetical protein
MTKPFADRLWELAEDHYVLTALIDLAEAVHKDHILDAESGHGFLSFRVAEALEKLKEVAK